MAAALIEKIERYLQQQQNLCGGTLYCEQQRQSETLSKEISNADMLNTEIPTAIEPAQRSTQYIFQNNTIVQNDIAQYEPETVSLFDSTDDSVIFFSPSEKSNSTGISIRPTWNNAPTLEALYGDIHQCMECKLGATRTNFVFGVGNPDADIVVIGEAPGADEDAQGEPFVGRAGQLLNKILEAINLRREDVYIANIIKCRPPGNRRPESDEVAACEPYLYKQIDLIKPIVILALGLTAVDTLLKKKHTMGAIRGKELMFRSIPMIATYHPAALLRNPEWKRAAWEDVQYLRRLYDERRQER